VPQTIVLYSTEVYDDAIQAEGEVVVVAVVVGAAK
jgi:hypothetical protein